MHSSLGPNDKQVTSRPHAWMAYWDRTLDVQSDELAPHRVVDEGGHGVDVRA